MAIVVLGTFYLESIGISSPDVASIARLKSVTTRFLQAYISKTHFGQKKEEN